MAESSRPPEKRPARRSRTLALAMFVIIVLSIIAFLVFRPNPGGGGTQKTNSGQQ